MTEIIIAIVIAFIVGVLGGALFYRRHSVRLERELAYAKTRIDALNTRMK